MKKDSHKNILFIINPISGYGWGKELPDKLKSMSEYRKIRYDIRFTEYKGHGKLIVEEAIQSGKYTHIVAAGGDGTVNEIGVALMGTGIPMGIIPLGSGNGFARHLGYSIFMFRSLRQILSNQTAEVDVMQMNDSYALNVNGIGFDADVAHAFNVEGRKRGPLVYIYNIFKLFFGYQEKRYTITCDGSVIKVKCFILSFANSSQYGNNAFIAPHASVRDGMMDICILRRPSLVDTLSFIFFFVNKRIYRLAYFKEIQCKEALIEGPIQKVHVDGDAQLMTSPLHLRMHTHALKIIVPKETFERQIISEIFGKHENNL